MLGTYRGKGTYSKLTDEQVAELLKLKISLELIEKENVTDLFISTIEQLRKIGVNCSKIKIDTTDTIETLAKKQGISRKQIEEAGLDPDEKIGHRKSGILQAYRGTSRGIKPTDEQVKRLSELGISLKLIEKGNTIDVFIRTIEQLTEIGVDCSKISLRDTIETLAKKSGINREEIEKIGLNPNEKIGKRKDNIAQKCRGNKDGTKPTDEQVAKLLELGISLEKKRSAKEMAEATISSLKDETAVETYDELLEEAGVKEKAEPQTDKANIVNQSSGNIDVPE